MATISPVELQKALKGADYPADQQDLARLARDNGADSSVVERIESLPKKKFDGPNDVSQAVFESE
jgi:hypothetical protein